MSKGVMPCSNPGNENFGNCFELFARPANYFAGHLVGLGLLRLFFGVGGFGGWCVCLARFCWAVSDIFVDLGLNLS